MLIGHNPPGYTENLKLNPNCPRCRSKDLRYVLTPNTFSGLGFRVEGSRVLEIRLGLKVH